MRSEHLLHFICVVNLLIINYYYCFKGKCICKQHNIQEEMITVQLQYAGQYIEHITYLLQLTDSIYNILLLWPNSRNTTVYTTVK